MTPQEQDLIQNVANKLKASPNKAKDADAERLINQEIGSQDDIVYKLTQAVLVQEMALKDLKSKSEFLEQQVEHYKSESERSTLSRWTGGSNPAPVAPAPVQQPSAFGSFMQTAAGVAAGMVAGTLISNALFGDDEKPAEETAAAEAAPEAPAAETAAAPEAETVAPAAETAATTAPEAAADPVAEEAPSSFLSDDAGFASDYASSNTDFFADTFEGDSFDSADSYGDFESYEEEEV